MHSGDDGVMHQQGTILSDCLPQFANRAPKGSQNVRHFVPYGISGMFAVSPFDAVVMQHQLYVRSQTAWCIALWASAACTPSDRQTLCAMQHQLYVCRQTVRRLARRGIGISCQCIVCIQTARCCVPWHVLLTFTLHAVQTLPCPGSIGADKGSSKDLC